MAVQTSYSINHGKWYQGQIADQQLVNGVSKLNKTGSTIEYGHGVFSDGDDGMKLGASGASALEFIGVVQRELNRAYADGDAFGVPDKRDGTLVTEGVIVVKALTAVNKDDEVFVRVGATDQGNFANAAGTGATESIKIPNAKFLDSVSAGELTRISLGLGG